MPGSPITFSAEAVCRWEADMREAKLAGSASECANKLGVSRNTFKSYKDDGGPLMLALACRALLHKLEPCE